MTERFFVVTADPAYVDTILAVAEQAGISDCPVIAADEEGRRQEVHLLVSVHHRQKVLDELQSVLKSSDNWRITILPVEATIPHPEAEPAEDGGGRSGMSGESREELYNDIARNARIDRNFLIFVVLSTIVAAIGLIKDNVAVVIGAMVIAPLLGPNLAFALGVALGDRRLMLQATVTNAAGLSLTLVLCFVIGLVWPVDLTSAELLARTDVDFDGIALALASGAAATLSLSTGLSSALVGVMVAVALLPPAATIGLMGGTGQWDLALGAALLLAVNVVCVTLAAQVAFLVRGITPRTWYEKERARRAVILNAFLWLGLLAALVVLLLYRAPSFPS